jgi:hypothetical protein
LEIGQVHTTNKSSRRAKRTKPVSKRQCHKDRAETEHVEPLVTAITEKHFLLIVTASTFLTNCSFILVIIGFCATL